jgi:MacB-like periplasmic core domain
MVLKEARRFLRRNPVLSLSAIGILSVGIGASAFALTLLLAFSSVTSPGMRFMKYGTIAEETAGGGSMAIAWNKFEELRTSRQNASLAAYSRPIGVTLGADGAGRPLKIVATSSGFFSAFTDELTTGRDFSSVEEGTAGRHVVILSFPLAVDLFKSPADALSRSIEIDGLPFQVIAVAPRSLEGLFGASVEAWVPANCVIPLDLKPQKSDGSASDGSANGFASSDVWKLLPIFYGVAASDRGSSRELLSELSTVVPRRGNAEPPLHVSAGLTLDPVRDAKLRNWSRLGFLLALAFTIATSLNYCGLLLARTPLRVEEVRLKRTLGAGSGRLMIELMAGPAVTVGVAFLGSTVLLATGLVLVSRASNVYWQLVRGSWHAALLALGIQILFVCALTLLIALIPALRLLRDEGAPRLGYASTATRRTGFVLQGIVTLQIASSIAACILAGMILSAVASLMREPLGYHPDSLSAARIAPGSGPISMLITDEGPFPMASAMEGVLEQAAALPGVRSASIAFSAPFDQSMRALIVQRMDTSSATPRTVNYTAATQNYFRTMGSRIVHGRGFSSDKLTGDVAEVVINQALEKELWPNDDPIGRSVRLTAPATGIVFITTIVGIVENMRLSGPAESPEPAVFLPLRGLVFTMGMPYFIITDGTESLRSLQDRTNSQLSAQMPGLGVAYAYSIGKRARGLLWQEKKRGYLALASAFSIALVAYIGLYGALAYYVNTRRRELAVRMCFGASSWAIRRMILGQAARCALLAGILSVPVWPMLARLSSSDWLGRLSWSTSLAACIALACISASISTSLVPAAAATRVSPVDVLKEQ